MDTYRVTLGLKTEYSDQPDGGWDDSDRYLVTTVRAESEERAPQAAFAYWADRSEWEDGYQVVSVELVTD